jgi:hypothetical protein
VEAGVCVEFGVLAGEPAAARIGNTAPSEENPRRYRTPAATGEYQY